MHHQPSHLPLHPHTGVRCLVFSPQVTARVFKIVLDSLKHYRSFLEHEALCFLASEIGTALGDRLHGRKTAATMLETIYAHQRDQAAAFLSTPNEYTKQLPFVGTAADKVCDQRFASWEIVNGRTNYLGTPVSFVMELRSITSDSADGATCLAEIDDAHKGLKVVDSQRRTYCFDGESCYQGEVTAVKAQLLRRDASTIVWHDPPHASELVKGRMHDEFGYIPVIHETIRQVYSYFSRSPKRWRGLEATAARRPRARSRWGLPVQVPALGASTHSPLATPRRQRAGRKRASLPAATQ